MIGLPDPAADRAGCYVYGSKVSDQHIWENNRTAGPWEHGEGPLCMCCGLPRGTYEQETKSDA